MKAQVNFDSLGSGELYPPINRNNVIASAVGENYTATQDCYIEYTNLYVNDYTSNITISDENNNKIYEAQADNWSGGQVMEQWLMFVPKGCKVSLNASIVSGSGTVYGVK